MDKFLKVFCQSPGKTVFFEEEKQLSRETDFHIHERLSTVSISKLSSLLYILKHLMLLSKLHLLLRSCTVGK